jgi:hypothetical protein
MSAISAIMHAFAKPNECIELGKEHYSDTPKLAQWICDRGLADNKSETTSLIFVETCSNPTGIVPDYPSITKKKRANPNMVICMDNTWLTSELFNPFITCDCDIVVESMSKYLSSGQCIGGMCVAKKEYGDVIFKQIRMNGLHVTDAVCSLVINALPTLHERVLSASKRSVAMRNALNIPIPDTTLFLPPPVFVVAIGHDNSDSKRLRKKKICDWLQQLCNDNGIRFETSFGASYSKIDCYPVITDTTVRIRVAAGYASDGSDEAVVGMLLKLNE